MGAQWMWTVQILEKDNAKFRWKLEDKEFSIPEDEFVHVALKDDTLVREPSNLPKVEMDATGKKVKEVEGDDPPTKAKKVVQELIGNIKESNLVYDSTKD